MDKKNFNQLYGIIVSAVILLLTIMVLLVKIIKLLKVIAYG